MATQTQTAVAGVLLDQDAVQEPLVHIPNVRPEGIEVAGERPWRDWRLRKRRPEIRERYTATFPDVNPLLDEKANALIDDQDDVRVAPFAKRTLADLKKNPNYRAEKLQFRPLRFTHDKVDEIWTATRPRKPRPQEELDRLPTFFFEGLSSSLFARVWDFAAETFGPQQDFDGRDDISIERDSENLLRNTNWTSRFLQYLPSEFVRCVSEVARGDYRNRGFKDYDLHGYEFLFVNRDQRIHLCTAVIAKLLQEHCFESLLFGARKIEREALRKTDEAQEDIADGFARKMSRTASVPKYLTHELFTANFWEEVDRVTMAILKILLPMINFVGELEPRARALPLTEVHQQLHNIVAEAGWLTNGLSLTRSCFWIDFPQPGQLWDLRQEHATDVIWRASKDFADEYDRANLQVAMNKWREARRTVHAALAADPKPNLLEWSRSTYERDNPRPRQVRRTAKVQISMWPFFERSYPYRQDLVSGDSNAGESTTLVQKAQVVYYAGDDADTGEQQEDYTLKQYLEDYKRRNAIFSGPRARFSWPIVVALLSLALYFATPSIRAGYHEVRQNHWGLPDYVIPNRSWPSFKWPGIEWPRATHSQRKPSSRSTRPSSSSKHRSRPSTFTSDVYSTRTFTRTTHWTTTKAPGGRRHPYSDDRKGSTTTVPTSWTSTGKHKNKQTSHGSSSTTVLPDTVGVPEPTEEPSPNLTSSGPRDIPLSDGSDGKEDLTNIHQGKTKTGWLDWAVPERHESSGISGDQHPSSFTTDVPPDVVFTDPARPGVTLNMAEGFWVGINPLGLEYNCWVRSRTAECTSTVWTTVTAEATAKPKVTEGPWKNTV